SMTSERCRITYSVSFNWFPVSTTTTSECRPIFPARTSLRTPATVAAEAGSQPTPSSASTAFASKISSSVTDSQIPPVHSSTRLGRFGGRELFVGGKEHGLHGGARRIRGHRRRSAARGGARDHADALRHRARDAGRHPQVLERTGGVIALVLDGDVHRASPPS